MSAPRQLILTVTRQCNLRCSYCPTAKDGWPSLTEGDARAAVALFCDRWGGGDIKLFGGEPLLVPDVVRAAIDAAEDPRVRRIYLSTNGIGLDAGWLELVRRTSKLVLTVSMDGRPEDHRRHRRALPTAPAVPDAYAHLMTLRSQLVDTPRVVVTQTIAPSVAHGAYDNFAHLCDQGFRRFNLLPGYYLPWKDEQLAALDAGLAAIGAHVAAMWEGDERFYLRNLFTYAPTPFFNTGIVVDADRTIHPSNVGLSGALEELLDATRCGTLDEPPTPEALDHKAREVNTLLETALPADVWRSTLAVDAALTRMVRTLYPAFVAYRKRRAA